jgi:hypothetical protein
MVNDILIIIQTATRGRLILGCTWTSKHPSLSHREAYITVQQCIILLFSMISILTHLGFLPCDFTGGNGKGSLRDLCSP